MAALPIGVCLPLAGGVIPTGWLLCDGSAVSRTTYPDLFAALGTTWGSGDGSTTFNVPDLRDRVPIGTSPGSLAGNRPTARTLGQVGGEESTTLAISQLPANIPASASSSNRYGAVDTLGTFDTVASGVDFSVPDATAISAPIGVSGTASGSGQPHNTMQPFAVCQWIINALVVLALTFGTVVGGNDRSSIARGKDRSSIIKGAERSSIIRGGTIPDAH